LKLYNYNIIDILNLKKKIRINIIYVEPQLAAQVEELPDWIRGEPRSKSKFE